MDVETQLASDLLDAHPIEAAQAFERLRPRDVALLLQKLEVKAGADVLQRMAPQRAAAVLSELEVSKASETVSRLPVEIAGLCLRGMATSLRDRVLASLPSQRARELRSALSFPTGTAGSLMDPGVLALPQDLTVREAVAQVREAAGNARYNVYLVDRDQVLVGVINLRELLMARPVERLSQLMQTNVQRLTARADRHTIVMHPGWREVHALPVVDERGLYLGAIRYRTLRLLEEGLRGTVQDEAATARALGGLLRAGAAAMLEAMSASTPGSQQSPELGRSRDGA
jgi:magnesium transporter